MAYPGRRGNGITGLRAILGGDRAMAGIGFGGGTGGKGGAGSEPPQAFARHAMIQEVRGYWEALRQGDTLPSRADIDPRGIKGALTGAFLIEHNTPGIGRLRIAGMNFTDFLGMDARGMPLSALFDPLAWPRLADALDQMVQRPAILDMQLEAEAGPGRPALLARMLLLPLRRDETRSAMSLGCLAMPPLSAPPAGRMMIRHLRADPVLPSHLRAVPHARARLASFAESPAPEFRVKPSPAARPYLRLVDTDPDHP